jgi:hypothetical protein
MEMAFYMSVCVCTSVCVTGYVLMRRTDDWLPRRVPMVATCGCGFCHGCSLSTLGNTKRLKLSMAAEDEGRLRPPWPFADGTTDRPPSRLGSAPRWRGRRHPDMSDIGNYLGRWCSRQPRRARCAVAHLSVDFQRLVVPTTPEGYHPWFSALGRRRWCVCLSLAQLAPSGVPTEAARCCWCGARHVYCSE